MLDLESNNLQELCAQMNCLPLCLREGGIYRLEKGMRGEEEEKLTKFDWRVNLGDSGVIWAKIGVIYLVKAYHSKRSEERGVHDLLTKDEIVIIMHVWVHEIVNSIFDTKIHANRKKNRRK